MFDKALYCAIAPSNIEQTSFLNGAAFAWQRRVRRVVSNYVWRRRWMLFGLLTAGTSIIFHGTPLAADLECASLCATDDLCKSICALRNNLTKAPAATQPQISQAQDLLLDILNLQKGDPTTAVQSAAQKLESYIKTNSVTKLHKTLRKTLADLKTQIELIELELPIEAAKARAISLTALLKDQDFLAVHVDGHASDTGLALLLQELLTEVLNAGKGNPTATVTSTSTKLSTFIKSNIAGIIRFDARLRDALLPKIPAPAGDNSLLFNIEDIEADLPDKAAIRRAESLQIILNKAGPTPEQAPYMAALSKADVLAKLEALKLKMDVLLKSLEPRIHIHSAYYGDLRKGASRKRRCYATEVMRTNCQRKARCDVKPLGNAADLYKVLCGFDPVPFAENRIKGAYVVYSCRTGNDDYWEKLDANPEYKDKDEKDLKPNIAILQSASTVISCDTTGN